MRTDASSCQNRLHVALSTPSTKKLTKASTPVLTVGTFQPRVGVMPNCAGEQERNLCHSRKHGREFLLPGVSARAGACGIGVVPIYTRAQ